MEVRELQAGDEFGRQPRYIKQWGLNVVMTPAEKDMIIVANDSTEREEMLRNLRSQHRTEMLAQTAKDRPVLIAQR